MESENRRLRGRGTNTPYNVFKRLPQLGDVKQDDVRADPFNAIEERRPIRRERLS